MIYSMESPTQELRVHGHVAAGFEEVQTVFEANFTQGIEVGASLCVRSNGQDLVNLWAGHQDQNDERPWQQDTLVNVYSVTKGIASLAVAAIVEDGHFDYSTEVRSIWPEFVAGQSGLSVGQLLSHQSGVPGVDEPVAIEDMYNWPRMIGLLEKQQPYWPPGTAAGYHALHWGFLVGEVVRRTTGISLGRWVADRLAAPLMADVYLGLPEALHARCADLIGPNRARKQPDLSSSTVPPSSPQMPQNPDLFSVALLNPSVRPWKDACSADWRSAEIAAANGQASGQGIATIYDAAANDGAASGVRVLKPASIAALVTEEVGMTTDLILDKPMRRGRGVILNTNGEYGPSATAFGHSGAGGALGFADPETGIGFGYAMNQMQPQMQTDGDTGAGEETRAGRLIAALYRALANRS